MDQRSQYRVNTTRLTPGEVILYKLRPDQRPLRPEKQWRGRILHVVIGGVNVESLEAGYEGLIEYVEFKQVVGIEQRETESL